MFPETDLEKSQRHVEEGEARVARQEAIVADLERDSHDVSAAVALLDTLRQTLELMYDDLAHQRARAGL